MNWTKHEVAALIHMKLFQMLNWTSVVHDTNRFHSDYQKWIQLPMFDSCWSIYFLTWNNIWGFIDCLTSAWMLQIPAWLASHNDSIVFLITFEEDCCSMTWGKLGGEKKNPLLSRFSENSWSCSPPNLPSSTFTHTHTASSTSSSGDDPSKARRLTSSESL